ncbi:NfeD family protein [Phormidesmis sp. 146-35]
MLKLKSWFQQLLSPQSSPSIVTFRPAQLCNSSFRPNPEQEAIVTQTISPRRAGQIEYQGSWWTARCYEEVTLVPGDIVYVIVRQHVLTQYVIPDPFARPVKNLPETSAKNAFCTLVCEATNQNKKPSS